MFLSLSSMILLCLVFKVVKTHSLPCRDKKERRREKQKGQQNGETSPTHNPMQPGENGIENPDFNKEVRFNCQKRGSLFILSIGNNSNENWAQVF